MWQYQRVCESIQRQQNSVGQQYRVNAGATTESAQDIVEATTSEYSRLRYYHPVAYASHEIS